VPATAAHWTREFRLSLVARGLQRE